MVATSTRNPMISLEGTLSSSTHCDYTYRSEIITSFQRGRSFNNNLMGSNVLCSIWDYAVGDIVKFKYADGKKACFYTITASDFMKSAAL